MARIVAPALEAVLEAEEVDAASVVRRTPSADRRHWYAEVELSLVGERFVDRVYESTLEVSVVDWRNRFASNLQDFVAESRFGWGQRRPLPAGWD